MKKFIALLALAASPANAWDGLTFGVHGGTNELTMEHPSISADAAHKGLHARYMWQAGRVVIGPEFSYSKLSGTINPRRRAETAHYLMDFTGVIGLDYGHWFPHVVGGVSYINTSLHGSEGYLLGAGLGYAITDKASVSLRYTYREFDGPAQGSDLRAPSVTLLLDWTF